MIESTAAAKGGFRLTGLELYNWGTFNNHVWHLDLGGDGALLTGANGSGKSTLVDALLTLLVPNKRRNYNLASGSEKRERNETSYVKGAFQRESVGGSIQVKYLRSESDVSALVAHLGNAATGQELALGQFFWFESGTLKKIYVVSHGKLAIAAALGKSQSPKDLRKNLAALPETTVFSAFHEYESCFVQCLGVRSAKALDLFNQITAIKQIGSLNDFVRDHMLEGIDAAEYLEPVYRNYDDLTLAHQAIVLAKRQLAELAVIETESKTLRELDLMLASLDHQQQQIMRYFFEQKSKRLAARETELAGTIGAQEQEISAVDAGLAAVTEQIAGLMAAQGQDKVSQRIVQIDLLLTTLKKKHGERAKSLNQYQSFARHLGYPMQPSVQEFSKSRQRATSEVEEVGNVCSAARESGFEAKEQVKRLTQEMETIQQDLQSAVASKNLVPTAYLRLRDNLCEFLSIQKTKIPYVAELVAVRPEEKTWEPAIERVLRGIALRLLVPDEWFKDASRFLKSKHVGLRITLMRVSEGQAPLPQEAKHGEPHFLWQKLLFHPQAELSDWIRRKIARDHAMRCCDNLRDFHKYDAALTPEGLVKRNANTVEKDDRSLITDRSAFIFGWTNEEKIELLRDRQHQMQTAIREAQQQVASSDAKIKQHESRLEALRALLLCTEFESIDVASIDDETQGLEQQRILLLGKNDAVARLKQQLSSTQEEAASLRARRDALLSQLGALTSEAQRLPREIRQVTEALSAMEPVVDAAAAAAHNIAIEKLIRQHKFNMDDAHIGHFEIYAHKLRDEITQSRRKKSEQRQSVLNGLIRKMAHFKATFPEYSTHLEATLESLGDFVLYKQKLTQEALPEHEGRFWALLNKSTLNDITAFKSTLDGAFEQIEADVKNLNHSLQSIPYSDNTYVQIELKRTRDTDVREFQNMLASTIKNHDSEAGLEEGFHRVKLVLDRLKRDPRWCQKVTDVRNFADFIVVELDRTSDRQCNVYSDSAGLSGGQKAKLAFTILGSALSYQYGLNHVRAAEKSFRFVVIDEAFSKSDDKNSRYALELFKSLGLQLMVVTPSDKVHVVEPYVKKIFLTQVKPGAPESGVYPLSIEKFDRHDAVIDLSAQPRALVA